MSRFLDAGSIPATSTKARPPGWGAVCVTEQIDVANDSYCFATRGDSICFAGNVHRSAKEAFEQRVPGSAARNPPFDMG